MILLSNQLVIKEYMIKNPYVVGDKVRLNHDIKDAYGEVWHKQGSIQTIKEIAKDDIGIIFGSDLGTSFKNVKLVKKVSKCKCCGQTLPNID